MACGDPPQSDKRVHGAKNGMGAASSEASDVTCASTTFMGADGEQAMTVPSSKSAAVETRTRNM
jgi:hypothetical protein